MTTQEPFEIGGLLFTYNPDNGCYYVADLNYGVSIGILKLEEGPGWVIDLFSSLFLDSGQLGVLSHVVEFLNSELAA